MMTSFLPQLPPRAWLAAGEHLRCAPGRGNFLQLALRKKAEVVIVRRPERIDRAFGAVQPGRIGGTDWLHEEHAFTAMLVNGYVSQHASVRRKRDVSYFIVNRNSELHARGVGYWPQEEIQSDSQKQQQQCRL